MAHKISEIDSLILEAQTHFDTIKSIHDYTTRNPDGFNDYQAELNLELALIQMIKIIAQLKTYRRKIAWGYFDKNEVDIIQDIEVTRSFVDYLYNNLHEARASFKSEASDASRLQIIIEKFVRFKAKITKYF
jgi:hypothetical protein